MNLFRGLPEKHFYAKPFQSDVHRYRGEHNKNAVVAAIGCLDCVQRFQLRIVAIEEGAVVVRESDLKGATLRGFDKKSKAGRANQNKNEADE